MDTQALVQNLVQPQYGELVDAALTVNPQGHQLTAQGQPQNTDVVRQGLSYMLKSALVACVTALPTTTASQHIWNGEALGGKSLVIDGIGWTCTTSAAAASMFSMAYMIPVLGVTANPSTTDTLTISGLSGRAYTGAVAMGHTSTVVNSGWVGIGPTVHSGALTATVGIQIWQELASPIIIPPNKLLCLACTAVNTTAVGFFSLRVHERQLTVL
jgi:hypothetical protein